MQMIVNGQSQPLPDDRSLLSLLTKLGLQDKRVAVERNGNIIPRSQHADQQIEANDVLEIVQAIGGG